MEFDDYCPAFLCQAHCVGRASTAHRHHHQGGWRVENAGREWHQNWSWESVQWDWVQQLPSERNQTETKHCQRGQIDNRECGTTAICSSSDLQGRQKHGLTSDGEAVGAEGSTWAIL